MDAMCCHLFLAAMSSSRIDIVTQCVRVSVYSCFRVFVFPCVPVSVCWCFHVFVFPCVGVSVCSCFRVLV